MLNLYFIGGASGSGKTAIKNCLSNLLGDRVDVFEIDDFAGLRIPELAGKQWRQETTETLLEKIVSGNKDACFIDQIVLGEILACPSAKKIDKINYCLLDVDDIVRIKRIGTRGDVPYNNQHMLNWASWLRVHTQDPGWEQHVIKDDCWPGLDFSIWDNKNSWPALVATKTINTTELDIEQVAAWIQS